MLTGESVPVMKEAVETLEADTEFSIETHGKLHVLYGGTKIVQHSPPPKSSSGLKGFFLLSILFIVV
jgi:cation-transporting ATPase 13A1